MNNPIYPLGYKVAHYRQARRLVLAASQAAGPLWEFQWAPTLGQKCLINRIRLKGLQTGNAAAEELRFNLKIARSFTAVDPTNTTSILRAADNQQLNTSSPASVLTAFVESNSATAPTGGTYTQDNDSLVEGAYVTIAAASTSVDGGNDELFDFCPLQEGFQLLEFRANEGWIINLEAAKSATQGFSLYLEVVWSEAISLP